MKVLHVYPTYYSDGRRGRGVSMHVKLLSNRLKETRVEVEVLTTKSKGHKQSVDLVEV